MKSRSDIKRKHLDELADYRDKLRKAPQLRQLFLELTMRCNEHCLHCGSRCGDVQSEELPVSVYKDLLDKVKRDFEKLPMLCITGGEPLLRKEIFEIMGYASSLGFVWGMTSNGILIDKDIAHKLYERGMKTISISIDGLEETHDAFRQRKGGYRAAVNGIYALSEHGGFEHIQVTTVITHKNIDELDRLFEIMLGMPIDSWRVINLEPIGRARQLEGYLLTNEEYKRLFDFIRDKRSQGYPVEYGCSHFLGLEYEREVRKWYYLCNAGVYTASIMANGDIAACLDIERRPGTIQGNILRDDLTKVWKERFEIFRTPLSDRCRTCHECRYVRWCEGGSCHSWDYDNDRPQVCFRDVLFT
ncbi:MAG: radical SAM protein [Oscillospiraceae bacterium]|nr:radical SAM protein [Oscillospiraceae bacterium]